MKKNLQLDKELVGGSIDAGVLPAIMFADPFMLQAPIDMNPLSVVIAGDPDMPTGDVVAGDPDGPTGD
jgi:hypothetical protein